MPQVEEGDFLEVVTSEPRVVCHFFHHGFERCKIVDAHLQALARKFLDTRFIKLSAPVCIPELTIYVHRQLRLRVITIR